MTKFQSLFGINETEIKNTCVFLPLIGKNVLGWLGVEKLSKGRVYSSGNSAHFTVIQTGMCPVFSGDAVLYLSQTQCKNIVLFGSCGLVKKEKELDIGSIVTPEKCYSMESFSNMLLESKKQYTHFFPDMELLEKFGDIKKVTCATLGSLKLEENSGNIFKSNGIQIVDMECSAVFSAAKHTGIKAAAIFYITDIIKEKPFYKELGSKDKITLSSSIKSACGLLCKLAKKNSNV